jgi:hypothetical protein
MQDGMIAGVAKWHTTLAVGESHLGEIVAT